MSRVRVSYVLLAALLVLALSTALVQASDPETGALQIVTQVNGVRAWQFDRYLTSDALAGRLSGTEGGRLAEEYIAGKFGQWGLQPAGDGDTYYQNFTFPLWYASAPVNLALVGGPTYAYGTDYTIFSYSGSVNTTAEVVFTGYGITIPPYNQADYPQCVAPTSGYDDYAGQDVTGKIVLVFRHGPNESLSWRNDCPNPIYNTTGGHWDFGYKSRNAYQHGASGMILVTEYRNAPGHGPAAGAGTLAATNYVAGIGAVWAHRSIGETLLPDLAARQTTIDTTLTPASGPTGKSVNLVVNASYDPAAPTSNVLGAIPGTDPEIGDEVIIVSAHYDHLGIGPTGEVYAGADDDGSGTAVMMEIAKIMASGSFAPKRTILFAAWAAEEEGLIGSAYYVANPSYPLAQTVAVLQMDMVGVGDRSGVNIFGGTVLTDLFNQIAANSGEVLVEAQPLNPNNNSDNAPFFNAGVPAVMVQTRGPHAYYHTPADTIETIDPYELEMTGRVIAATAYELAMDDTFEPSRPEGFIYRHTDEIE